MLLSPGIQIFESSVSPAAEVVANTNGVATLGYSTRGPLNKLVRLASATEFANIFGSPVEGYEHAHILVNNVLAQNAPVYFMRIGSEDAAKATCPVTNITLSPAKIAIAETGSDPNYFTIDKAAGSETALDKDSFMTVVISATAETGGEPLAAVSKEFALTPVYNTESTPAIVSFKLSIYDVLSKLSEDSNLNALYDFKAYTGVSTSGVLVTRKKENTASTTTITLAVTHGSSRESYGTGVIDNVPIIYDGTGQSEPTAWNGNKLGKTSTESTLADQDHFVLSAKSSGSGMNDIKVIKSTNTSAVPGGDTWNIRLVDTNGVVIETIGSVVPKDFVETVNKKSAYIDIQDFTEGTSATRVTPLWTDGTYVLGEGMLLSSGSYWNGGSQTCTKGTDGVSEDKGITTSYYVAALGSTDFTNCDENTFSVLATPCTQEYLVQQAAIAVCEERGDAIYLVDVPEQMCHGKDDIDNVVEWSNSNPSFFTSYAAIYYGTFAQVNPYNTAVNIQLPASVFIAPRMMNLDNTVGEFYAPAGVQNGTISVADYGYSPDQADRDLLVGNGNVVNPIIYSNTRGVMAFAQKTTDRSNSPLNRVGVRRMTNAIKRKLRSRLQELLFRLNNEYSRSRARRIVDGVMLGLQNSGAVEGYTINVVSGTGAARNELNVYLTFQPFGLIEKIYVYVNITDAGVEVSEAIA